MAVFRQVTPEHRKAFDFLKYELKDGRRVPVVELREKAKAARVSRESLAASRKLLRVVVTRDQSMKCLWQLPS